MCGRDMRCDKMATSLYEVSEVEPWKETFELYEKVLKLKAEKEKKEKAVKLLDLDNWYVSLNTSWDSI